MWVSLLLWAARTEHQTGWLINDRNVFLSVVQARRSKIEAAADSVSGEDPSWFIDGCLLAVSPHDWGRHEALLHRH